MSRLIGLFKSRKKELGVLLAFIVCVTGFDIVVPLVSQHLIDTLIRFLKHTQENPRSTLLISVGIILVATVASKILKAIYDYRLFRLVTKTEDGIRHEAFEQYLRLHALFHHGSSSGQLISRIDRGRVAVYAILNDILGQGLVPPLIIFAGVLATLLYKNAWIALVVILPLPIYLLSVRGIVQRIYEIERRVNDCFETVARESYDVASNVFTVKKFSREHDEVEHQIALQNEAREVQYSAERLWSIIEIMQTCVATVGRVAVILLSGFLVMSGKSTVGEFVLYITLQNMAYAPLWQLSFLFPRLRRNMARVEGLFNILDEPVLVTDKKDARPLPEHASSIEFKSVSFRYSTEEQWALKDVSFNVPAGGTIALVGPSGSGKTTFINLLLRAFDPEEGAILIDGCDIKDTTRISLLKQVAVVPQEVDLFSRTIFANLAYGKPDATQEEVEEAAKIALAHDFITRTEYGYRTLIGERGITLSGGQRQRIGIARALLRNPRILIFDEATNSLDAESEKLINEAMAALMKNRTNFIIAHRFSTIPKDATIIVFNEGQLEAIGTHATLIDSSATYKKLYELQSL